jgi:hypothetical protein
MREVERQSQRRGREAQGMGRIAASDVGDEKQAKKSICQAVGKAQTSFSWVAGPRIGPDRLGPKKFKGHIHDFWAMPGP